MMSKFEVISLIVVALSITNYCGWTSIPWILLQVPIAILSITWIWAILVVTVTLIINGKQ
jgi:hypothetical protein